MRCLSVAALFWVMVLLVACAPGVPSRPTTTKAAAPSPTPLSKTEIVDLIDHTRKYKGKTFTIKLLVNDLATGSSSLRNSVGQEQWFRAYGADSARLDILILLPPTLDVPAAQIGDSLIVTLVCKRGDLEKGNEAIQIVRPK